MVQKISKKSQNRTIFTHLNKKEPRTPYFFQIHSTILQICNSSLINANTLKKHKFVGVFLIIIAMNEYLVQNLIHD